MPLVSANRFVPLCIQVLRPLALWLEPLSKTSASASRRSRARGARGFHLRQSSTDRRKRSSAPSTWHSAAPIQTVPTQSPRSLSVALSRQSREQLKGRLLIIQPRPYSAGIAHAFVCSGAETSCLFQQNYAHETWACDFLLVGDLVLRQTFVFFLIELGSRRVLELIDAPNKVRYIHPIKWNLIPQCGMEKTNSV
jgi:hypothetical protein